MSADGLKVEVIDAEFVDVGDNRRQDRRARDRRTGRAKFDTLFAATLVNQIEPAEEFGVGGYVAKSKLRAGIVVNVKA